MGETSFDLRAALARLHGRGRLLILTHDNPDPDSIACALGLQLVVATAGIESTLGVGGIIGRAENRAMVRELGIELQPIETLAADDFPLIALVDTQPGTGNNSLFPGRSCDIVIDHHAARELSHASPWCDIREEAGASCMIAWKYLHELGITLDKRMATAFLYALKSETRDLGREAGAEEAEAYIELLHRADLVKMHAIVNPKLGREHFAAVDRAIRGASVRGEMVTVNLGPLEYPDLVAEVADMLLSYEAARWVLCAGVHRSILVLSVRTDITTARAGELIRRIIGPEGAGGGHGMIAGGRFRTIVHTPEEIDALYQRLIARFAEELGITGESRPLI